MRALSILLPLLFAAACSNIDGKLADLDWGNSFEGDYAETVDRARQAVLRHFPNGFDPDKTREEEGDFWTIWHYDVSVMYRKTIRRKAHVQVQPAGEGKVRVGISVVTQLNDNIDNPHDIDDARWVRTRRDPDLARIIEEHVARRYLDAEPSDYWREKQRDPAERGKTLRKDLVDRARDVDLGEPRDLPADEE